MPARPLTYLTAALFVFIPALQAEKQQERPPNIVVILADDLGYGELSCQGQTHFATPHIDRLATEGVRFTDFYAGNTVCSPSRASLWTGRHPGHASIRGNQSMVGKDPVVISRAGISADERTIGSVLQERGYRTALLGKWHVEAPNDPNTFPEARGFDYSIGERWDASLNQARMKRYRETDIIYDYNYPYELWENGQRIDIPGNLDNQRGELMDDIMVDRGLRFIKENRDKPFFAMFSLKIPHNPETFAASTGMFEEQGWPEGERVHAERIVYLDNLVRKIVDHIDHSGLRHNTLIIFTSDNGGHSEGGYLKPASTDPWKHDHQFFSSNAPLRGYKRDLYEGGIRVPFIARWPGRIQPGTVSNHPAAFWDLLATFADLSGQPERDYAHDGISIIPTLLDEGRQKKHPYLYWEFFSVGDELRDPVTHGFIQAARMGDFKAVRYGSLQPTEIYDLSVDIGEAHDIAAQRPDLVAAAEALFVSARTDPSYFPYGGGANLPPDFTMERLQQ